MTQQEFTSLIEQHRNYVTGFIYNLTQKHADKEDIISDSILMAWKYRDRVVPTKFRSWWSKIAKNCLLAFYKKNKKSQIDLREDRSYVYYDQYPEDLPTESNDVRRLKMILEYLPPRQREVFVAFKGNGLSCHKNSNYSSRIAWGYSNAAIENVKALWKIFDISPDIQKITLLSTQQAGDLMGVSADTVISMINRGDLKAILVGNKYKIEKSWISN